MAFIGPPWPMKMAGARPFMNGRSSAGSDCDVCAPEARHAASKPPATAIAEPARRTRRVGELFPGVTDSILQRGDTLHRSDQPLEQAFQPLDPGAIAHEGAELFGAGV